MPSKDDYILTFNYTETVEKNYSIDSSKILHIHGKTGEDLIVGHNNYRDPDLYNVKWDEDSDYRSTKAMEEVDNVLIKAAKLYYKDSESVLECYREFFEHIDQSDKVVFLGLSCGEQDYIYVKEIVRRAENIDFFWYDEGARERFQSICNSEHSKLQINFIKW